MTRTLPSMKIRLLALSFLLAGCATDNGGIGTETLRDRVTATELAFAATMADRDFDAFSTFIAPDAIFFSGDQVLRGKQAVLAAWKPYFDGPVAPFSWRPKNVEVLPSSELAISTGPVFDPDGNRIATFTSIWRRGDDTDWRIIFDKGCSTGPAE